VVIPPAFAQQVVAMMAYITELETVACRVGVDAAAALVAVEAEGHDLPSLLYNFLDEWLYQFNGGDLFVCRRVTVDALERHDGAYRVRSRGVGERFELGKHPQGTEIKAITYSAMRITETAERTDILTIVDI
tara:strand:+ start:20 stop:415 length:396 start_codon:yes stop_codon:yes gene_type:complete